jgi:hypothetical protein
LGLLPFDVSEPSPHSAVSSAHEPEDGEMKFIAKSIALTFTLVVAWAPMAALAQTGGAYVASGVHKRYVHQHAHKAPGEARLARPAFGQPPQESPPAISRDPNDCVKTMCTCLGGGGC